MPKSQDLQHTFNVLKRQYNDLVGDSGNQFLYSTTPGKTTYYVFRDTKISGIHNAINFMRSAIDAGKDTAK